MHLRPHVTRVWVLTTRSLEVLIMPSLEVLLMSSLEFLITFKLEISIVLKLEISTMFNSAVKYSVCWYRFGQDVLPYSTQCLLFDGSNVPVKRPQNVKGQEGHTKYTGSSPIFITTKLADVQRLAWYAELDPETDAPRDADASMMYRRLKVYPYTERIPKPPPDLPYCGRCFAELVLRQSGRM